MKNLYIIALHLSFGGIEKAICSMANMFSEDYNVEILSVYNLADAPAFPLNEKVKVRYLTDVVPNRDEWFRAVRSRNLSALARESIRSIKILAKKKLALIRAIKEIDDGIIITTRHEDNLLLSKYGNKNVLKIAQIHHDHGFKKKYVDGFKNAYGGIDILAMLTTGLRDEAEAMVRERNQHTRVEYIPNFLEHFPECTAYAERENTVLAVGRLDAVKRFDLLIKNFADIHDKIPGWKMNIVGDGSERDRLHELIKELGAEEYVFLKGAADSAGVEREMLKAAIYAMTSSSEGFPFVLLEAQSCGLPVIAYDVRVGPGFVVDDGVNGILVKDGDDRRFKSEMLSLIRDPEKRAAMSCAGLSSVRRFSRENVSEIWRSVIGGGHGK